MYLVGATHWTAGWQVEAWTAFLICHFNFRVLDASHIQYGRLFLYESASEMDIHFGSRVIGFIFSGKLSEAN